MPNNYRDWLISAIDALLSTERGLTLPELVKVVEAEDAQLAEVALGCAFALLGSMLLVSEDARSVWIPCRNARHALSSLRKFLAAGSELARPTGTTATRYRVQITRALETFREASTSIDHQPIHERRVVNVLVKARMVRYWRKRDVFLHMYHPDWGMYHLIGLGVEEPAESDESVAQRALAEQLRLQAGQYSLGRTSAPPNQECAMISRASGALTRYVFQLFKAEDVKARIPPRDESHRFRWFTWEEIQALRGEQGEWIMPSTLKIMSSLRLESIPYSAVRARDARARAGIRRELSMRFTVMQILCFTLMLAIGGLVIALPVVWPKHLEKVSQMCQIAGSLLALLGISFPLARGLR